MSFFDDDYILPKSGSGYTKLQPGDNKLRILSKPIVGWLDWHDKTPVRTRYTEKPPTPWKESRPPKHFWAMIVYNYLDEEIQIWEITQKSIQHQLQSLILDVEWGEPYFYDIKITRTGQDLKVKYAVSPIPHKPSGAIIQGKFEDKPIWLDSLFSGKNPFEFRDSPQTPGIFSKNDINAKAKKPQAMSPVEELKEILSIDDIDSSHVDEYLSVRAKEKNVEVDQVATSSLQKEILPKFKKAYLKWLLENDRLQDEAVPF